MASSGAIHGRPDLESVSVAAVREELQSTQRSSTVLWEQRRVHGLVTRSSAGCRLANGTRAAVDAWGLKLLCQEKRWQSDSLTVISVPESVDSADVVTYAFAKHNLTIGVGLGQASL